MIDVRLTRIVFREGTDRQYIFLSEVAGSRSFPIVIGTPEASEIHRVVLENESKRPLTHQLAFQAIQALGGEFESVDIVDLKENTFYARLRLRHHTEAGDATAELDARPSDAIALALRANCRIRVDETVMARACDPKP